MYPFTREFPHPDEPTRAEWDVVARWRQDGRRFPVDSYGVGNLAWRGNDWRTLTSAERAQIHGFPPAAVKPMNAAIKEKDRERIANCAIGNGFHCPSMMVIMILLLQAARTAAISPQGVGPAGDEVALRKRIEGTVFDENYLAGTTGLLSPDDCVTQMELLLNRAGDEGFAKLPWRTTRARLRGAEGGVRAAQRFWAYESTQGRKCDELGPITTTAKERAKGWAYLGMQRAPGTSSRGLDHLLQPGMGRDEHIKRALELPSPYSPGATHEPDVRFAARAMVLWGPHVQRWREEQMKLMDELKEALRPLTEALRRRMPETVKRVAKAKDPAMIAALVILMRWPDRELAAEYVMGHKHDRPHRHFRSLPTRQGRGDYHHGTRRGIPGTTSGRVRHGADESPPKEGCRRHRTAHGGRDGQRIPRWANDKGADGREVRSGRLETHAPVHQRRSRRETATDRECERGGAQ